MNSYYGRIGGDDGGYYEAPLDTAHYDDLTEEQAKELSKSWGNTCFL